MGNGVERGHEDHVAELSVVMIMHLIEDTELHPARSREAQEACEERYVVAYDNLDTQGVARLASDVTHLRALMRVTARKYFGIEISDEDFARLEGRTN